MLSFLEAKGVEGLDKKSIEHLLMEDILRKERFCEIRGNLMDFVLLASSEQIDEGMTHRRKTKLMGLVAINNLEKKIEFFKMQFESIEDDNGSLHFSIATVFSLDFTLKSTIFDVRVFELNGWIYMLSQYNNIILIEKVSSKDFRKMILEENSEAFEMGFHSSIACQSTILQYTFDQESQNHIIFTGNKDN